MIFFFFNLFVTSYVAWYVGTHESTISVMCTNWDATNDFMMGKSFVYNLFF